MFVLHSVCYKRNGVFSMDNCILQQRRKTEHVRCTVNGVLLNFPHDYGNWMLMKALQCIFGMEIGLLSSIYRIIYIFGVEMLLSFAFFISLIVIQLLKFEFDTVFESLSSFLICRLERKRGNFVPIKHGKHRSVY